MTKKDNALWIRKLVKEFLDSDRSQIEFASAHGIKEIKLQYWQSKLSKPAFVTADRGGLAFRSY